MLDPPCHSKGGWKNFKTWQLHFSAGILTFPTFQKTEMRLTPKPGVASHLSQLFQLACSVILVMIQESRANCYTSEIRIPALQNTKHIEVSINVDDQIAQLEESIRQLAGELDIEKSQIPIFLALLCLAGQDLSETVHLS